MIPLRDINPIQRTPIVTIALVALNTLVFLYELLLDSQGMLTTFIEHFSVVPYQLLNQPQSEWLTIFTAMFMHGGWAHLLGNMLYLWIFGDNIEDRLGHGRFLLFYLLSGVAATFAQVAIDPNSTIPNLGASGAIAGVLGGYLLLYPRSQVTTLVFRFVTRVPAVLVLGFWFVYQFFSGVFSLSTMAVSSGGVAFFAHIGGFVAGFLLIIPFQIGLPSKNNELWG